MNNSSIEKLAYLIKQAKEKGLPQPIVFLGAGASRTGGVPLADEIINDILEKYKENPDIKLLDSKSKTYKNLMACLTPFERKELLNKYIDKAKINVTHIYLAQLLIEGYVDYVITVNFDNLMLRALALFNNFPPTYDLSNLKDLTTSSFKEGSVVYLHGQHHGLWLLNTDEEMAKVDEVVPPILNSIKNQRPWIFIGYSGEDPIFKHITKLGAFANGLYWVTYYDHSPNDTVCKELLEKANMNAFLIKGYDADSFMLKLNAELKQPQPIIIEKPFTSLKQTLENIVDIDDKEHFKGVKERLVIVKRDVDVAIQRFEVGTINPNENVKQEFDITILKKRIIDKIIKGDFKAEEIETLVELANNLKKLEINMLMAELFNSWGNSIYELAKLKNDEGLFEQSTEKYKRASELNSKSDSTFNNWGISIYELAKLKNDEELYKQSFEKFKRAIELNPKSDSAFYNWGNSISELAKLKNDEGLYGQSFEKYKRATEFNPKSDSAFYNWGISIYELAKLKNDEGLYEQSFEKYKRATELNPKSDSAFNNWGISISELAKLKNDEELFEQSIEKTTKAIELGSGSYNLACIYAKKNNKSKAIEILENCLKKKEIDTTFVASDDDWKTFLDNSDFIALMEKYKRDSFNN